MQKHELIELFEEVKKKKHILNLRNGEKWISLYVDKNQSSFFILTILNFILKWSWFTLTLLHIWYYF